MAKWASDYVLDGTLVRAAEATRLFICDTQPTTYQEASNDFMLAEKVITPGDGNGVFTIADGDSSGRKLTVAAQSIAAASNTGTATHVALADSANSRLLLVTTLPGSFAVTSGQGVNVPEFKFSNPDPV